MASLEIVTGYKGEAHITSTQDRAINKGSYGTGSYILAIGQRMAAEAVSATEIRIKDGALSHQGCVATITPGGYQSLTISNGSQGMLRTDLIVARYTKTAGTSVEEMTLEVIEGTPASSNPTTPSYYDGTIQTGDSPVDMPLYAVHINGITIDSIEQVAELMWTQKGLKDKMGTASLATTATNLSAAINEHEGDINTLKGRTINGNSLGSGNITLDAESVGAAPTSHASSATTYGQASPTNYGHAKVINNLTQSSYAQGEALSAYQGYLLNNAVNGLIQITTGKAPTSQEAAASDPELFVKWNGQTIGYTNHPSSSFLVFIQTRAAGDAAGDIYSVAVDTSSGSGTKIAHLAGTNAVHTLFVSSGGNIFVRTTGKTVGYYADIAVIKTR